MFSSVGQGFGLVPFWIHTPPYRIALLLHWRYYSIFRDTLLNVSTIPEIFLALPFRLVRVGADKTKTCNFKKCLRHKSVPDIKVPHEIKCLMGHFVSWDTISVNNTFPAWVIKSCCNNFFCFSDFIFFPAFSHTVLPISRRFYREDVCWLTTCTPACYIKCIPYKQGCL